MFLHESFKDEDNTWTTVPYVLTESPEPAALRATFRDHTSGGVHATWINEKLVFVESFWGRVKATNVILDIDNAKTLYMEDADYFGMSLPPCD